MQNNMDLETIKSICHSIGKCAQVVYLCDSVFKDHRGKRSSKWPGRATVPEMMAVLGITPPGKLPEGTKGTVDAQGNVTVYYRETKSGPQQTKTMPSYEVDAILMQGNVINRNGQFGYRRVPSGMGGVPYGYGAQNQQQNQVSMGLTLAELGKAAIAIGSAITAIDIASRAVSNSRLGGIASKLKTTMGDLKRESIAMAKLKR